MLSRWRIGQNDRVIESDLMIKVDGRLRQDREDNVINESACQRLIRRHNGR